MSTHAESAGGAPAAVAVSAAAVASKLSAMFQSLAELAEDDLERLKRPRISLTDGSAVGIRLAGVAAQAQTQPQTQPPPQIEYRPIDSQTATEWKKAFLKYGPPDLPNEATVQTYLFAALISLLPDFIGRYRIGVPQASRSLSLSPS